MVSKLNPYLGFRGNAREALEFYQTVFGGDLRMNTFAEYHAAETPAEANQIMHGQLVAPNGMTLMASDTPARMPFNPGNTITISLSGEDEAELRGYWDRLSDGATIAVPLAAAPWGDSFGMLADRFGTAWMVNIAGKR